MTRENGGITPSQAFRNLRINGSRFAGDIRRKPSGGVVMSAELFFAIGDEMADMEEERILAERRARSDARLLGSYEQPRRGRGRPPTKPQGI